jgi:hypothetical protein
MPILKCDECHHEIQSVTLVPVKCDWCDTGFCRALLESRFDNPYRGIDWESEPNVEATGGFEPGKVFIHSPPDIDYSGYGDALDADVGEFTGLIYLNPTKAQVIYGTARLGGIVIQYGPELPNAFHRFMFNLLLGIVWELKNPGLHRTWWWKIRRFFNR